MSDLKRPLPFFVTVESRNAAHPNLFGSFEFSTDAAVFVADKLVPSLKARGIDILETRENHWESKGETAVEVDLIQLLGSEIPVDPRMGR